MDTCTHISPAHPWLLSSGKMGVFLHAPSPTAAPMLQVCCLVVAAGRPEDGVWGAVLGVRVAARELASGAYVEQTCQLLAMPLLASPLATAPTCVHYRGY